VESKESKYCTKCRVLKKIEEFSFRNKTKGYRHSECRECLSNREKIRNQDPIRKEAHRLYGASDKAKAQRKIYYQTPAGRAAQQRSNNSIKGLAAHKAFRESENGKNGQLRWLASESGKLSRKKIDARWSAANPEKVLIKGHRYRARRYGIIGQNHTEIDRENKFLEYGGRCAYEGRIGCKLIATTLDHIIPLVLGGTNEISNCVPACGSCNSSKGGKPVEDWKWTQIIADELTGAMPLWL